MPMRRIEVADMDYAQAIAEATAQCRGELREANRKEDDWERSVAHQEWVRKWGRGNYVQREAYLAITAEQKILWREAIEAQVEGA